MTMDVLCQVLAVSEDDVAHVSHAESVNQDVADRNTVRHLRAVRCQLKHVSRLQDKNILFGDTQFLNKLGLSLEVTIFSVHGNGIFWLDQSIDQLNILLAGVSGYMNVLEYDVRPLQKELIDHVGDRFLIARDGAGGEDNGISLSDRYLPVNALRHAAEGRHALALTSRRDNDGLLSGVVLELVYADQGIGRYVQAAQFGSRRDDIDHAAAFHDYLPTVFVGGIDDLLYPVHVGSEGRNDDPRVAVLLEELVDGLSDRSLRGRKAGALGVCGVAKKRQDSLSAQFSESLQIDRVAVYWRVVDLEVARVHHDPRRCVPAGV